MENCTEQRWRNCAGEILLVIYADRKQKEKALEIAYQMPTPRGSMEYALTYIFEGDDLIRQLKANADLFAELFTETLERLDKEGHAFNDCDLNDKIKDATIKIQRYI